LKQKHRAPSARSADPAPPRPALRAESAAFGRKDEKTRLLKTEPNHARPTQLVAVPFSQLDVRDGAGSRTKRLHGLLRTPFFSSDVRRRRTTLSPVAHRATGPALAAGNGAKYFLRRLCTDVGILEQIST